MNDTDRRNQNTWREICPSATLSSTNSPWIGLILNLDLRGLREVTNCQSRDIAVCHIEWQTVNQCFEGSYFLPILKMKILYSCDVMMFYCQHGVTSQKI